uniref:Uncharacterized protein n=1 Tax=viral metagenome TaxID=1070528 RepID=A0A6M3IRK3_9ZZZZ
MRTFSSLEEFNKFCDESMFCVCGNLMTGLHMSGCRRLAKMRVKLIEKDKKKKTTSISPEVKE